MRKKVAILMGGWSTEREVSLVSGTAVSQSLKQAGYQVTLIDVQRDIGSLLAQLLPKPDVVFNALHGRFGEDGSVQALLDILDIPYTYSGLLASAIAMDKPMSKRLFEKEGLSVAKHIIISRKDVLAGGFMSLPYVIKPTNEGSSVGVHIVKSERNKVVLANGIWPFGEKVMVEAFIEGRELTVSVMGDQALAVTEITTDQGFYNYSAKYEKAGSLHVIPAKIEKTVYDQAMQMAVTAHQALGCRGVSRADFRYDGQTLYILEVNTQPGMTPMSLVPEQAAYAGISFEDLVVWMVENAECDS
jgi:D-alanine-D-alanine ligase